MSMDRIAVALERIAAALEAANEADPLAMLQRAAEDAVLRDRDTGDVLGGPFAPPREALASNGQTIVYEHPQEHWHFVARRHEGTLGGWLIQPEPAE